MYGMMNPGGMYPGMPATNPVPFQYPAPSTFNSGMGQPQPPAQSQEQSFDGLTRVTGMQGAKMFQLPANSRVALFDDTEDIVIIKMTDGAGFPTYRRARLDWLPDEPENDYMTRAEFQKQFDELKGLILNGKQSVRRSGKSGDTSDGE